MQFGRYKIITELGEGGMAVVYLGEDPTLNRLVAVKVIHSHLTSHKAMLERFAVEARIAAALKNPHIVDIYDYGLEDNRQYFIMEYIGGHTLDWIISSYKKASLTLPQRFCASVICQAAEGLMAAEKLRIVHRDIKPSNLMFTRDGFLKISDFGIAKLGNLNQSTNPGSVVGTPLYISPEQYADEPPTIKSDIWALGITFYLCLTGEMPFSGDSIPQIIHNVCTKEHQSVMTMAPNVDPELAGIVDIMLRKDPEQRCEGAEWLVKKLRQYLGKRGIFSPEDGTRALILSLEPSPHQQKLNSHGLSDNMSAMQFGDNLANISLPSTSFFGRLLHRRPFYRNPFFWGIIVFFWIFVLGMIPFLIPETTIQNEKSLTIYPDTLVLFLGEQGRLRYKVTPREAEKSIEWESSNPGIISVFGTVVTAKKTGHARIQAFLAEDPQISDTCYVRIIPPSIEKLSFKDTHIEMLEGENAVLNLIIDPPEGEKLVSWTVEPSGHVTLENGRIGALSGGEVRITAFSSRDSTKKTVCLVTVKKKPVPEKHAEAMGSLRVTSAPPFARIRVRGEDWGTTPMRKARELPLGRARVEISHRSRPPKDTLVFITKDVNLRLHVSLEK